MFDSSLNPQQRAEDLSRLAKEHFDVLVIGGGINGVGVALDAVTRGLTVALVEGNDFALRNLTSVMDVDTCTCFMTRMPISIAGRPRRHI